MNQYLFASRNILDKLRKTVGSWETFTFYWRTYVTSRIGAVRPDVYVVSYPKCGRTWVRMLLREYVELAGHSTQHCDDKSVLAVSEKVIVKFEHGQGSWVPAPPKTKNLCFNSLKYRDRKVAFLVRDPRDVLVSSWYHLKYRERIFSGDLSAFIRDDLVGIHKVVAYMNMWMDNRNAPDAFLLMTYEDMHKDPFSVFWTLLEFIGFDVDGDALRNAIGASRFDKMKEIEKRGTLKEPWMKPGARNAGNSMKIRKGEIGGYKDELSADDIAFLDDVIRRELSVELPYNGESG